MSLPQLKTEKDFDDFIAANELSVVVFSASWAPQCSPLHIIIGELAQSSEAAFAGAFLDAESVATVSMRFDIKAAPTTIMFANGKETGRVNGFEPSEVRNSIAKLVAGGNAAVEPESKKESESLNSRIEKLLKKSRLVLFMKGNREQPKCGFSRQIIELLNNLGCEYWTFDILQDEEIRQGLKEYSDWPTYPQLYLDAELLGGLDVVKDELADPSFVEKLPKA
uniref:Thioredoxin domain-containing protein n=1 Tax=Rhabditophanes sp. KR3021 TaxID=114890 RepID=A0AC35TRV4_9BILA